MTASKNQFIRQNKNFLNHPMFAIDEITANEEKHCWSPVKGFRLETDYKLPTKSDQVVLYFFMLRSQETGWQTELVFSRHEILKNCSIPVSKRSYDRLNDTLERWFRIRVYFQESFVCAEKVKIYKVSGAFRILEAYNSIHTKYFFALSGKFEVSVKKIDDFQKSLRFRSRTGQKFEVSVKNRGKSLRFRSRGFL